MRVAVAQWIEHTFDWEWGRGFDSHQSYAHQMAPDLVTGSHFLNVKKRYAGIKVLAKICQARSDLATSESVM